MIGICAPNGAAFGLDWWADMEPPAVLVMEAQAGHIAAIRTRLPNARIYLRVEAHGRAWDPPQHYNAVEYADYCARLADQYRPDCLVPWNEANIEWASFGDSGGKEGYALLRDYARRFVNAYRERTSVPVAFPALSPGHHEDDYEEFGKTLAFSAALFDELHLHNYWTRTPGSHLSEWEGQRAWRQIPMYEPKVPVVISEFNREYNPNDADDVRAYLKEIQEWRDALHPAVKYVLYFIADTDDPAFFKLAIKNNRTLVEGIRDLNRQGETMSITANIPVIVPGEVTRVNVSVKKPDGSPLGTGIITGILNLPLRPDQTAYTTDPVALSEREVATGQPNTDGDFVLAIKLNDFELDGDLGATLKVNWIGREVPGPMFAVEETFDVTISKKKTSEPPVVVSKYDLNAMFYRLGDIANQAQENYVKTLAIVEELQSALVNPR